MSYILAVDGGGTGCRAAVADIEGRVLGRGRAGPANTMTDADAARANILAATRAALDAAGNPVGEQNLVAVLGLAGVNIDAHAADFAADLPFALTRLESDALTSLRGALGADDGVVAIIGTGSVFGVQRSGGVEMLGGWGLALRDEASGAWLGRALLTQVLRAHDGLVPETSLLAATARGFDGPAHVARFACSASPADFAALAPGLFASPDDRAAAGILARAETHVRAAIDLLCGDAPLPVCFTGGLGAAYASRLTGPYGARLRAPAGSALDGALTMARTLAAKVSR